MNNFLVSEKLNFAYNNLSLEKRYDSFIYSINNEDYDSFWTLITLGFKNINSSNYVPNLVTDLFKKFLAADNTNLPVSNQKLLIFFNGFIYFLNNQKHFNHTQLCDFTKGIENTIFCKAIALNKPEYLEQVSKFITNKNLEFYSTIHEKLINEKNVLLLKTLYQYTDKILYDNGKIFHIYFENNFYNYEFTKEIIIKYNFDINTSNFKNGSLFYALCSKTINDKDFFNSFLKDFGNQINLDIIESGQYTALTKLENSKPILETIENYSSILTFCNLSEKNLSQITNYIFNESIVSQFYNHIIYDKIFNHKNFNSKYFDRNIILNKILDLDNNLKINNLRNHNNNIFNPIVILLDKFYKTEKPYHNENFKVHPFIYWANQQSSSFCIDTCNYLINKYKNQLLKLNSQELKSCNPALKNELSKIGITYSNNFFSNLFTKKNTIKTIIEEPIVKPIEQFTETINLLLLQQVKDTDIIQYIDSIKLNSEQYLINYKDTINDNTHYITNLLPRFLNKSIDTYLHFSMIEPITAKENLLVQLKLLNKKTFEILNEELLNDTDNALRNTRIQNKVIKSY